MEEDNNFHEVKLPNLGNNNKARSGHSDIFSERKEADMNDKRGGENDVSEVSQEIEEEDASDLYYDKELKILIEDHKRVTKFTMIVSMLLMGCQIAFAIWCLGTNQSLGTWEDALLINWYHLLKIFMNCYVIMSFI